MTTIKIITDMLERDPKELFSIPDILQELKLPKNESTYKQTENILRNLRLKKIIHRHKDRDINDDFQYAVKMAEKNIEVWELNTNMSLTRKGAPLGTRKTSKKGKLPSKKEIQSMFAAQYNTLARLEDEAMKIIDEFESVQKEMLKIRNFIGK